jgi:hypothetical protein
MTHYKKTAFLAWLFSGAITLSSLWQLAQGLLQGSLGTNALQIVGAIIWKLFPVVCGVIGALIISKQSRNVIGWLLMIPANLLVFDSVIGALIRSVNMLPPDPSFLLFLAIWFAGTDWVLLIFPILFILLLFPNGTPPTPRWRWVLGYGIGLALFFFTLGALARDYPVDPASMGIGWSLRNPLGLFSGPELDAIIFPWWVSALGVFTILSVGSLAVRYQRTTLLEREQIKWLLYAAGLFALFYVPSLLVQGNPQGLVGDISNLMLALGLLGFPFAIGIAILRYRLWDIDLIIRRTLIYSTLTVILAFLYFGVVILLQQLFRIASGQASEIAIIISTLTIAALFNPLRRRIQQVIDQRFYRRKYNAQQVLNRFAATARDEVELERLSDELLTVVSETMQPASVSMWLKKEISSPGSK